MASNDCRWLDRYMDCCRNTKTHPNCWISPIGAVVFVEPQCLRCEGCGYEPITPDAPAWDALVESESRLADEYFVKWQAAAAEANRLRDIVRDLANVLETFTLEDHEIDLVRWAREAIKEGES